MATDLVLGDGNEIIGLQTYFGMAFACKAVILTAGTFLNGTIWVGKKALSAGRAGEPAAIGMTETLHRLGFETDRLKTRHPRPRRQTLRRLSAARSPTR